MKFEDMSRIFRIMLKSLVVQRSAFEAATRMLDHCMTLAGKNKS